MIPFTPEVFLSLFEQYNGEIWPAQIVAYALGLLVIAAMVLPVPGSDRAASAVLAGFWLWNGAVYHLDYFASINFSAYAFGVLFIIQADTPDLDRSSQGQARLPASHRCRRAGAALYSSW